MRYGIRLRHIAAFIILVVVTYLLIVLEDKYQTYDPLGYGIATVQWYTGEEDYYDNEYDGSVGDKLIVIPAMQQDDTSWLAEELPDWQRAIYLVNPSTDGQPDETVTTPINKGHEAMAYLSYIIDHYYHTIPSIVVFLHSHRGGFFKAWHVDTPFHDNVEAMRSLQLNFVKEEGYVNLRCNWTPGCAKSQKFNPHVDGTTWNGVFTGTSTPFFRPGTHAPAAVALNHTSASLEPANEANLDIRTPCCAQFALSREQILQRPFEDYVSIRRWLMETKKDDAHSGRALEYLWHIIFGRGAVHCPDENSCYCQVYGRC